MSNEGGRASHVQGDLAGRMHIRNAADLRRALASGDCLRSLCLSMA
jgi:hypothetical protein